MSPATVQRVHGVARRALSVGVRWGWLAANPAFEAMPPRSMRRAITPPTPDEVLRLIEAAEPDLATFVLLAASHAGAMPRPPDAGGVATPRATPESSSDAPAR